MNRVRGRWTIGVSNRQQRACLPPSIFIARATRCSEAETRHSSTPWRSSMSTVQSDWIEFIQVLEQRGVEYMIVGGVAVGVHGHVRFTKDLDVWFRGTE